MSVAHCFAKAKSVTELELGEVIGECMPRHRAKEVLRFLKKIGKLVAKPLDVHVVGGNYGTHKTKEVETWLKRHKRFKLHFTPTSSSWLNLVERLFAEIARQRIRRGVFRSLADLEAAHPSLHRRTQQQAEALQVDSEGRYHPRQECPRPRQPAVLSRGYQMNGSEH
jgi:hypothetical protein